MSSRVSAIIFTGLVSSTSAQVRHGSSAGDGICLGNEYFEIGVSQRTSDTGKFHVNTPCSGFYGRRSGLSGLGTIGDADGFGVGADLRIDYFLPGSPLEGWEGGYKTSPTGGATMFGSAPSLTSGTTVSVEDVSTDSVGGAIITSTYESMEVKQKLSFGSGDHGFLNEVTLKNIGSTDIYHARFMRYFDPDNTVDYGGGYTTIQKIIGTIADTGYECVSAESLVGDAYYTASGGQTAKIAYFSTDPSSKVSYGSHVWSSPDVYSANIYDTTPGYLTSETADSGIFITYEASTNSDGHLAPGETATFQYFSWYGNSDFSSLVTDVATSVDTIAASTGSSSGVSAAAIVSGEAPPPAADTGVATGAICFTGDSLLTLEDGSTKKFRELKVGDVIMGADRAGKISASPVIFLPHEPNDLQRKFDEIVTTTGKTVRMTRNHLLPTCDGSLVTARSIKPGDCVMTLQGEENVAKSTANVNAGGVYTAVTKNEFLVVDGVIASPFALAHGIAHSLFDREDVTEWCNSNSHLVTESSSIQGIVGESHKNLFDEATSPNTCVDLMKALFENYKDEGVGWGSNGWGYRNFKTLRGVDSSLEMHLSGFNR